MPRRISKTILFTMVFAIVALFAAAEALAGAGDPYPGTVGPDYSYFEYRDFRFEFLGCDYDNVNDETTCSWMGTELGENTISHLLITLRPDLVDSIKSHACSFGACNMYKIIDGTGDPSTKIYGRFLGLALLKFTGEFSSPESEVSLTFDGRVGTEIGAAFIKSGVCYVENDKAYCPNSSFGPVQVVGEYCEATIAGIGSTGGCFSVAEVDVGTIYLSYETLADGCTINQTTLELFLNDDDCNTTTPCPDPPTAGSICTYGPPEPDCTPADCSEAEEDEENCPGFCIDAESITTEIICAQPGANCPVCVEVESGSPICLTASQSGTGANTCIRRDNGQFCPYEICCVLGIARRSCGP